MRRHRSFHVRGGRIRVLGLLLGLALGSAAPLQPVAPSAVAACEPKSPRRGEPLDLDRTLAWAAPSERDLLHRQVDWHPAVIDGVLAAQAADRPLVLWLYFGGPLGDC